ncbi:DNA cytosine methyltransferase [Gordonia sp. 4N]|uniref:DNA cytosine methyltransferase n=1 Tax=Gordonia sp. 4N TaxID=2993508 RepID=UPI002248B38F|nr:DNA cytosine methyltransferase [Gordonia sp. 4N]MCX2755960.1 DNA cytosine methyltransferase [Gordonia sp. 4N]
MAARRKKYSAVSLFSGCGGMDLGAIQTGRVAVKWAIDQDPWAVATYRKNIGDHIVEEDIAQVAIPNVPCDILLAGPPCQDYSTLWNHDGLMTARGNLFRHVARYLDELRPAAFVLENVPGLLSANRGVAWTLVRHALKSPSRFSENHSSRGTTRPGVHYNISAQVVDMADLGVPQHRERLIVVGVRRDLGLRPPIIPAPHSNSPITVREALDLKPIPSDAPNHERGQDSKDVVERLRLIPPGANFEAIPDNHPLAVRGLISHVYRRLDPDKPSYTIIAGGGGGTHGYHHREPRRLSNREKARLQSFPDDFIFEWGSSVKDRRSAYTRVRRQVGNAVPPTGAKVIVQELVETLIEAGIEPARSLQSVTTGRTKRSNSPRNEVAV